MTNLGEPMEWDCSMCNLSYIISPTMVYAHGEERCAERLESLKQIHIDMHCSDFAEEMEVTNI